MHFTLAAFAVIACLPAMLTEEYGTESGHLGALSGLSCPSAGYMLPDSGNLCFVHFCERAGEAPIKRACPKGVRVPSWWEGGELNMCNIVNILKHGGQPTCLRCAANDVRPEDNCGDYQEGPCDPECTCIDTEYTHRCDCPVQLGVYHDGAVDAPVDHCTPNQCENGASCQNQWDGFFCFCPNGFTGHRCETPICDWHPCFNGATCIVDEIGYHCKCTDCFGGACCNVTLPNCERPVQEIGFQCPPCYTGEDCKTKISSCGCEDDFCRGEGLCVDADKGPTCQACDECMTGPLCKASVDSCKCNNKCPQNARCEDLSDRGSHECICNDCYTGENCEKEIVNCECNNPCGEKACTMVNGQPSCDCADSCKTGEKCDQTVNTCQCNPCPSGADCFNGDSGPVCECSDPCMVGANCDQKVKSCVCDNPCNKDQKCAAVDGALTCSCKNPCMEGPECNIPKKTCGCSDPCQNGGQCEDSLSGPICQACDSCFTGAFCDVPIVNCDCNSPCDGVCNMVDDKPVCGCPDCMTGEFCDVKIDSCECNNQCINKDTCKDTANGAVCVCDCKGNEVCHEDEETGEGMCKCPVCYVNMPGETSGCKKPVEHLCICNNPCTADQQVCVDAAEGSAPTCKIGNPSSGNAFTVVFEENHTEKSLRQIPLELYLTPSNPDSGTRFVNIRSPGLPEDNHCYFNTNVTIKENDVYRFEVDRCMRHNKTGLDHVSIRLTELNNDTMLVYGINKDRWSADGFLATPDVQAGTEFQTVSYSPAHRASQFAIAALFDDTVIDMTFFGENDLNVPAGSTKKITMQAFETYQVQATCPINKRNKKSSCSKDLSGTVIKASKPVHVFSGNIRAFVKAGEGLSRDHLVEELVPIDRWGKYFGLVTVPTRAVGDVLHIMAIQGQTTTVTMHIKNGGAVETESFTLPSGGKSHILKDVPSSKRIVIESTNPIYVTQLTKSKDTYLYDNETVHDPVTITVPPTQQFTNNFFVSTPMFTGGKNFNLQPYDDTYAMLVAEKGTEGTVTLDGSTLTQFVMPWGDMPKVAGQTDLVGAVISVPHGTRIIRNTGGSNFQCLIYGFADRESYGFPAAMNFAKLNNN